MKRKTTKEILAESFRELAENRPVDKITIQEIVDNCDFSPATFYRHFRDKYDLIAWDYMIPLSTTALLSKICLTTGNVRAANSQKIILIKHEFWRIIPFIIRLIKAPTLPSSAAGSEL